MEPIIFLGKELYINPIALEIGPFKIYWYGLIIVIGIFLAFIFLKKKDGTYGIKYDDVLDFAFGAIILGFICARIYYCLFKLDYYLKNPLEIFMIWNGGIAIYGGIIGAVLYGLYYSIKKKIKFLDLADLLIPYLALAQSLGRWGNFINREAYGYETNLPWKMGIYDNSINNYIFVHPTFLYESICTFIIFVLLTKISRKRKFSGQIFYLYMILYGIVRAFVEGFRTDSLMLANFRISQVLSVLFVIIFGFIYYKKRKSQPNVEK